MGNVLDVVEAFFQQDGWTFSLLQGRSDVLELPVTSEHGSWGCFAQAEDEDRRFIFYSVCPVTAPEGERRVFAEFLTRANYGLVLGNFEMDWDDGEIRYKTSIDFEGDRLTPALIRQVVYPNVRAMGTHLPAIRAIVADGLSADQALKLLASTA